MSPTDLARLIDAHAAPLVLCARQWCAEPDGTTAHLRGTPPIGYEKSAPYNLHYEITLQK